MLYNTTQLKSLNWWISSDTERSQSVRLFDFELLLNSKKKNELLRVVEKWTLKTTGKDLNITPWCILWAAEARKKEKQWEKQ